MYNIHGNIFYFNSTLFFLSKINRPILKIISPNKAQPAITPVIGKLVPLLSTPTNAAEIEPISI